MVWHARPVAGGRHSTKKRRDIPTCVTTCITGRCNCLMAASVERFKCRLASLLFSFFVLFFFVAAQLISPVHSTLRIVAKNGTRE